LASIPDGFADEVAVHGRLRKMAPRYHAMEEVVTRTRAEQDALRGQLADEFAVLKAIFIGKGRDSSWGPKVVELGFAVRTVDRWVVKKLASGRLPSWVEERLRANQSPKPGPDPAALLKTKVAIYLTAAQRSEFLACAEQLGEERLTAAIFRSVVGHPPELPGLTNLSPGLPAFRQTLGNQSTQSGGCNPLSPTDPAGVPPSGGMSTTTALTTNDVPLTPALMKLTRPPQVWDCHAGKDYPADAAYVGCRTIHPFKRHVIREGTIFGNGAEPLASHEGSLHSEVEFRAYAVEKLLDPSFLAEAETLRGRDLLCWCVQNGERRAEFCHARVWLELINNPSGGLRNPNASAEQRRDFDWGYYEPNFLSKAEADALFGMASAQPRTRPTVQRSGHPLRRCASTTWSVWDEHAEPLPLMAGIVDAPPLQCKLSALAGTEVNYFSLQAYEDERDHIGWHQHREDKCRDARVFIISLGERRSFGVDKLCPDCLLCDACNQRRCRLRGAKCGSREKYRDAKKHRQTCLVRKRTKVVLLPGHGSLIALTSEANDWYEHAVLNDKEPKGLRISINTKCIPPEDAAEGYVPRELRAGAGFSHEAPVLHANPA
jgi:hypothetical protein